MSSSPHFAERSPKRPRQNGGLSQSEEVKSARHKPKPQVVNGASRGFENVDVLNTGVAKLNGEGDKSIDSPRKKVKKAKLANPYSSNGVHTPSTKDLDADKDVSNLFFEHDRLLPGAKRTSLAESYASSKP